MRLELSQFDDFFSSVNEGRTPFQWQRRLVEHLARYRRWPTRISAPTGSGKTAVIEAHIFAVALTADEPDSARRLPRRLSLVVDRRALVDEQHEHATRLAARLGEALGSGDALSAVAENLLALRTTSGTDGGSRPDREEGPLAVVMLRGGVPPSTSWRDDPLACTVICATPDMWGSRLLFRGYGTNAHARPREAGLLAYDSVVVVDEAHLARQLVHSARRIADLERTAARPLGVGTLQVVEVTATPVGVPPSPSLVHDGPDTVAVAAADLQSNSVADRLLARRLCHPKPLRLVETSGWPARGKVEIRQLARQMAELAVELREKFGPTVGCVANTVAMAVAVSEEIPKVGRSGGDQFTLETLVGRMRPFDIQRLRRERPGLFTTDGDPTLDFVVATQTIEVGIDMDLSALVTELASGSALAQRAGRVNRLGKRGTTEVVVLVPPRVHAPMTDALPYLASDLSACEGWLWARVADPSGIAPWGVHEHPAPTQTVSRMLLQRPEMWDAWLWARTSDDLVAEPDMDIWLADDLNEDRDISLVVRQAVPADPASAVALLRETPPRAKEAFPVSLGTALKILGSSDATPSTAPVLVIRGEETTTLGNPHDLRPGDVLVAPSDVAWFRSNVVLEDGCDTSTDVLETDTDAGDDPFILRIAARAPSMTGIGDGSVWDLLADFGRVIDSYPHDGHERRDAMAERLRLFAATAGNPHKRRLDLAAERLDGPLYATDVAVGPRSADSVLDWLVIKAIDAHTAGDNLREEWLPVRAQVPLAEHQRAVAQLAADLAASVCLEESLIGTMEEAGRYHDEGKRDGRFQAMLRSDEEPSDQGTEPLAKSGSRAPVEARKARALSGLPSGWRHEQLSAAAASRLLYPMDDDGRDLAVRLIGTSHGWGRAGFPHMAAELIGPADPCTDQAALLFDDGDWDALIERTHAQRGVWGCAYLEALLRAADCQVSRSGR
jgi:CRISPR-associated endonuclease/helicase Cas3